MAKTTIKPIFIFETLLLCLSFSCCTKAPEEYNGFVAAIEFPPDTLDPRQALSAYSQKLSALVYTGLTRINEAGEPVPDLAEKIEQIDTVTYRFLLRHDVFFHDGHHFSADDAIFTFKNLADEHSRSPFAPYYRKIVQMDKIDDYTVELKLKEPYAPFLVDMAIGILPEHVLGGKATADEPKEFPGTGPFKVASRPNDETIIFARNERYYGKQPTIDSFEIKTVHDDTTRLLELISGKIDFFQNAMSPAMIPFIQQHKNLSLLSGESSNYTYLGLNLKDPILSDVRVRKAIAYAIDRDKLIRFKFNGEAQKATGLLTPGHWAYNGKVAKYDYNPELAKQLLDSAGYTDPDGDGEKPRFKLIYKTSTNKFRRSLALAIAADLKKIGIEVEVRTLNWGVFFEDIRKGRFQICSLMWTRVIEPDMYYLIFNSANVPSEENPGGYNRGGYENKEVDFLSLQARKESDREQRKVFYTRIQEIIADELPYISLWHENNVAVMQKRVKGYKITQDAFFSGFAEIELAPR